MRIFTTRLFAAFALTVTLILALTSGWQAALLVFLSCTLLAHGNTISYSLGAQTFTSSEQFLQYMQATYGSANFSQWQSIRKQFYSFLNYPQAGTNQLNFFGFSVSGTAAQNQQYTNMPKAGSFGQQFMLLKSIQCVYYVATDVNLIDCPATANVFVDTKNPAADLTAGFFQAGHFLLSIGAKPYVEFPKPFLYAPPADGQTSDVVSAVGFNFTLTDASPGVTLTTGQTGVAYGDLNRNSQSRYLVDPNILIEAEQQFAVTIDFPSGLIPLIATNVLTNNLYVGVILDGILFRPVQ